MIPLTSRNTKYSADNPNKIRAIILMPFRNTFISYLVRKYAMAAVTRADIT